MSKNRLTHLDDRGAAHMVDIAEKPSTARRAVAKAMILMTPDTRALIMAGGLKKGDALATARIAGIMAAKRTADLIPLCHPLPLTAVSVDFEETDQGVAITAVASTIDRTGVEMEALTAAGIAALTLYDMAKAVERGMRITDLRLVEKAGGKSGFYKEPVS